VRGTSPRSYSSYRPIREAASVVIETLLGQGGGRMTEIGRSAWCLVVVMLFALTSPVAFAAADDAGAPWLGEPGYPPEMPAPPPEEFAPPEPPPPEPLGEFGNLDAPEPDEEDGDLDSDPYGMAPDPYGARATPRPRPEPTPNCNPTGAQCTPGDW